MSKQRSLEMTGRRLKIPVDKTRTFPVAEANVGMLIKIGDQDVRSGIVKDPWNCAIANSACRTVGAYAAMVGATMAYIVIPVDGEDVAVKFAVPPSTRRAIEHFDVTGEMPAAGFLLTPVPERDRSGTKRARNKRDRQRWHVETHGAPATGVGALRQRNVRSARSEVVTISEASR